MSFREWLAGRLKFLCLQAGIFVVLSALLRMVLLFRFGPGGGGGAGSGVAMGDLLQLFGVGLHVDLAMGALALLPVAGAVLLVSGRWLERGWRRRLLWGGCGVWWGVLIFLWISEFYFFKEYLARFNTVAIDYVHYWTEVSGNIREMYPVRDIIGACVLGAAGVVFLCWQCAPAQGEAGLGRRLTGFGLWLGGSLGLCATLSLSEVQWSAERLFNEMSSNGLFSGAVAGWTRELPYGDFYATMPRAEAFAKVRAHVAGDGQLVEDPFSIQRRIAGDAQRRKLNVVLLLEESFGSEFWGVLNGAADKGSLTPRLDELAQREGLLFERLYADGNRTIRGIEGVLASFPPMPGDSIVARTRTQDCETIAQALRRDGYSTTFIYPGRGVFDGLGRFALGNGFDTFLEQKDFKDPAFTTVWGACDEDLYDKVLEQMREKHGSGQPFLITALSVTNHQPFTYPAGRIPEPPKGRSRRNAVKYVDYALGRFFDMARKEPFWKDTVFVVVADHGARVYGKQTIPIRSYKIPMLVLGPAVVEGPRRIGTLGCQLDVAPTILGMIGRPYDSTFFGHDLLKPEASKSRVLLNHNRSIGIFRDEHLVVLGLNRTTEYFSVPKGGDQLEKVPVADALGRELEEEATAFYQVADELYMQRRYKVGR